jgi:hypothetical protein
LAKKKDNESTAIAITPPPGFVMKVNTQAPVNSGGKDAFIWIAHKMSKMWDDVASKIQGLTNGNLIFVSSGHVEKLPTMKYHLIMGYQFFAEVDGAGGIVTVYDKDNRPKDATEFVECVLAVYTSKGLEPARVTFKKSLCGAVADMIAEFEAASGEEWAGQSPDHDLISKTFPTSLAGFRFYGIAGTTPRQTRAKADPKTGKMVSFEYSVGSVQVKVSTSTEALAVTEALRDPEFTSKSRSVMEAYNRRLVEIEGKRAKVEEPAAT